MQGHKGVLEVGQCASAVRVHQGPDQFIGGSGEGEICLGRNRRPLRMVLASALVPPLVQFREQMGRRVEPANRARARRRHMDVEDPRERRFVGEKRQIGTARYAEYLLIA